MPFGPEMGTVPTMLIDTIRGGANPANLVKPMMILDADFSKELDKKYLEFLNITSFSNLIPFICRLVADTSFIHHGCSQK